MNIENMTPEELIELHHKVCKRLMGLNKIKLFERLQSFEIGDHVSFKHGENIISGTVIRVNQKSLSIKTKEGARWYVDPRAVRKIYLPQGENRGNIYREIQVGWSEN
jgi:hypothetical protein